MIQAGLLWARGSGGDRRQASNQVSVVRREGLRFPSTSHPPRNRLSCDALRPLSHQTQNSKASELNYRPQTVSIKMNDAHTVDIVGMIAFHLHQNRYLVLEGPFL